MPSNNHQHELAQSDTYALVTTYRPRLSGIEQKLERHSHRPTSSMKARLPRYRRSRARLSISVVPCPCQ